MALLTLPQVKDLQLELALHLALQASSEVTEGAEMGWLLVEAAGLVPHVLAEDEDCFWVLLLVVSFSESEEVCFWESELVACFWVL